MSYNLDELKIEYQVYLKENQISQAQIQLLKRLYRRYCLSGVKNEFDDLETLVSHKLDFNINTLDELTYQDTTIIINYFNKELFPLCQTHMDNLEGVNIEELSTILEKPINSLTDITRNDYYKLVINPKYNFNYCLSHFYLKPKDTIILSNSEYEYGYQESELCENNRMYYLKFYNLMVIDYDNITLDEVYEKINNYFGDPDIYCFYVYQTYRGYHLYYMSSPICHLNVPSCHLMKRLGCDLWYILFSHKNGFKIRLSPKMGRDEKCSEVFLKKIGRGEVDHSCQELIDVLNCYHITKPYLK